MSITIDLPKRTESQLRKRARNRGFEVDDYIKTLVERDMLPSWEELVRPIHAETKRMGFTEKEIEELVDTEIAALRKEKPLWTR